ncbi:hypothetical protein QJS66_17015 [Kocuria rhizophila]|nr:hypothetical protein QJS66_17015 [Kocuria rhizophila]
MTGPSPPHRRTRRTAPARGPERKQTGREGAHQDRVSRWTEPFLQRRSRGEKSTPWRTSSSPTTRSPPRSSPAGTRAPGSSCSTPRKRADWKVDRPATAAEPPPPWLYGRPRAAASSRMLGRFPGQA